MLRIISQHKVLISPLVMTEILCNLKKIGQPYLVISGKLNFIVIFQQKLLASALEQLEKILLGVFSTRIYNFSTKNFGWCISNNLKLIEISFFSFP